MEEKGNKRNQVLLTVIGVATLLVAVIGATFAYFTANGVQNNVTTNNIQAQTAKYGDITVNYDATYSSINTGILDLKESEKLTYPQYEYLMKLNVVSSSDIARKITINWANVTNNFCQYANGQVCSNNAAHTYVGDQIVYDFYSCTSEGYDETTAAARKVTVHSGCTKISELTAEAVPITGNSDLTHTAASLDISAGATNYYALVVSIKNIDGEQNYQQEKNFTGRVIVGVVQQ